MGTSKLNQIITNQDDPKSPAPSRPRSNLRHRIATALPVLIVVGFLLLFAILFGGRLLPATTVETGAVVSVAPPLEENFTDQSEMPVADYSGSVLFQASGWIEAAPLPIKVPALVSGVVESVEVLEGDAVEKGQVLVRLVKEDAELDLRTAIGQRDALEAKAEAHLRDIVATQAEEQAAEKRIIAALARRNELADPARRLASLSVGNVSQGEVEQARLRVETQEAQVAAVRASRQAMAIRLTQLEVLVGDFDGQLAEAEAEVDRKQLALERTEVKSPANGIVQRLLVVPGQKRMLYMDAPDSSTVAILFQPDKLQARIDVPLEQAAKVLVGQPVRLKTDLLPDLSFQGLVTNLSGGADIQRNTLEAKVLLTDPHPRLRPEMLCRAEFLAEGRGQGNPTAGRALWIYSPEEALIAPDSESPFAWVVDPAGRTLEKRPLRLGQEVRDGYRRVLDGLRSGEKVVIHPPSDLQNGQRIAANPN